MNKFPKCNPNVILTILLLTVITFSIIKIVMAVAPNPGHNFTEVSGSIATGNLIYGSATDVFSALADVATGNALISGGVGVAPSYGKIALTTHVSGILPTANGGTGIAFFTAAGPTVARIYTFPDAAATVLTTNAAVTVAQGGTGLTATADDAVFVGDSTSAVTARALPSCSGATTDKLLYNISTNTFSCGVDQTGGGGGGGLTPVILGANVESLSATVYATIFTIPMTVSMTNVIRAILVQSTSAATIGIQTRGRVTTVAHTGYCSFVRQSSATADANIDNIAVTTGPVDTAQTAELSTVAARTEVICTVVATAAAGDLVLEFQSETGGSVKTLQSSYYTKVVAP